MNTLVVSRYLDRVIKFASLGVVLLVPLAMPAFQSELNYAYGEYKSFILHLAALIIALALTGSLVIAVVKKYPLTTGLKDKIIHLLRNPNHVPAHVLLSGMFALVLAFLISTLMSPLPLVSFFGAYEEFNGTNFYDYISLSIVFFGIALKFRDTGDLKILLMVMCMVGTLVAYYGLLQHFGWDGLGGRQHTVEGLYARSPSSFGNSLNFSAFLVLTITASLSMTVMLSRDRYVSLLIVLSLGIQIAALWLGGSRGCYLGVLVGVTTFMLFVVLAYGWRGFLRVLLILGLGAFIAFLIASRPASVGIDPVAKVMSIGDQVGSITGAEDTKGLEGGLYTRSRLWGTAFKLLQDPQVPQDEFGLKTELRRLYGLGPDMFVHSYPLAVSPIGFFEIQPSVHNIVLQVLVTTGILGCIGLLIIAYGIVIVVLNLMKGLRQSVDIQPAAMLTAVFLAMGFGKFIEMQTGVSRISDLLPTFAAFGGLVASISLIKFDSNLHSQVTTINTRSTVGMRFLRSELSIAGVAIIGCALFLVTFIGWDMRRISASAAIYDISNSDNPALAGQEILESNRRAPDRQYIAYRIYETYVNEAWTARLNGQADKATMLMLKAREVWLPLESRNPYEIGAQLALAKIASTLVSWGRVEFLEEVRFRYGKIAKMNPGLPTLVGTASTAFASIGDYELAITLADQVIATEDQTHGWSKAWYSKGSS
ncbi:MAG: hypothetical protein VYC65_04180, partial [Chloroflexota bacterium]|nr:hypothetical protein [Chloroflexota bacterium]